MSLRWHHHYNLVRDIYRMVVGFRTSYAISAYHHWRLEYESRSGEVYSIQDVINVVSNLWQVGGFLGVFRFPLPRYNWNIGESGIKHHNPNPLQHLLQNMKDIECFNRDASLNDMFIAKGMNRCWPFHTIT